MFTKMLCRSLVIVAVLLLLMRGGSNRAHRPHRTHETDAELRWGSFGTFATAHAGRACSNSRSELATRRPPSDRREFVRYLRSRALIGERAFVWRDGVRSALFSYARRLRAPASVR